MRALGSSMGLWAVVLSCLALGCGKSARSPKGEGTGGGASSNGETSSSGGSTGFAGTSSDGSDGGAGAPASGGAAADALGITLEGEPIYTRVQRLTNAQWERAVTDILHLDAPSNLAQGFEPPLAGVTEFTNNERLLVVDEERFLDFESASEAAAALATGTPEALAELYGEDDPQGFVRNLGRRAFRRPLTEDEEAKYLDVFALGEELYGAGLAQGAALVIRALLQSPHFLYRTELGPAGEPLNGYELASKLSFWLLGTTPSDALLDSAEQGELDSVEGLVSAAEAMLDEPAAVEVMRDFHRQLYRLDRYASISKGGVAEYSEALNPELAEASQLFFDHVFEQDQGLSAILTSTQAFVGPGLAPLYGLSSPSELELVELGEDRVGYFMQVPFLLLTGANAEPNSIARGLDVINDVLCAKLPPPDDVAPQLPAPVADQTNRERITDLTSDCGDCHQAYINPLGFAFEGFDGMGRARELDNGRAIDSSGSYPFVDGTRSFDDAQGLMQLLADSSEARTCYAKKVTGYALGRDIVEADRALLEELANASDDGSLKQTIIALVKDPAFRSRPEGSP